MNKPNDFAEWFCLRSGRRNFQIDPTIDSSCLFGDTEAQTEIRTQLERAQVLGLPLRFVWWGQYGIGKTHRLRHTARMIKDNGFRFSPYYVICGDIDEKTGFGRLHYQLISVLDRESIRKHVTAYVLALRTDPGGRPELEDLCGTSVDVKNAIKQFGSDNDQVVLPAWQFLCGMKLDAGLVRSAGVTKPMLDITQDYYAVIRALATIVEWETGKQILYLIDEAEKLARISNKSAEATWNEALRALLDISNLNVVFTVGGEKLDQLPRLLVMPDIVRRIQKDHYVEMEALSTPNASAFVSELTKEWVDPAKREALIKTPAFQEEYPDYDSSHYPFADAHALKRFVENVTLDPRESKPSVILHRLNGVAAEAYFKKRHLITMQHLEEMNFG